MTLQHNPNTFASNNINIAMQQELNPSQQNVIPYQPIKFVYTQTIGSVAQKFKQIIDPYTWTYQDILEPKILISASKVEYYLFHIAPIYNWLRKVDSNILANYLMLGQKGGNPMAINKPTFGVQKGAEYKKFEQKAFFTQIKHYLQQWQIVKLCTCAKVKIITTKTDQLTHQSKNFPKTPNQPKPNQQMRCTHIIKKQKFTHQYTLNDFTPSNIKLQCTKVFCDDCQQYIKVKSQITKYPFAPYFTKYYGKEFVLGENSGSNNRLTYQLVIVCGQENIWVRSSGGVWYKVERDRTSVVSFDKIDVKTGLVFVYQQAVGSSKVLRKAEPMFVKQSDEKRLQQLSMNNDDDSESENQYQQAKPKFDEKTKNLKQPSLQKNQNNSQQNKPKPQNFENQAKQDEVLQDMSKNPLPIILNKKTTDRKLFKQYKKTVEGLLPKPKEKDQYEKNYDKGKTKKIHKNRQSFRTADFFKLYKDIKHKDHNQPVSGNNMQENNQPNEKQKKEKNNRPYRQKDEQYNQVYQDKRGERKSRGHFGNKLGNKFNKNRQHYGNGGNKFGKKGHNKKFGNK